MPRISEVERRRTRPLDPSPGLRDPESDTVLPLLFGGGMHLTPALAPDTGLTRESERALPGGSVELVYGISRT